VFYGSLIFLPITILISFITAAFFVTPITKVKHKIKRIASGDYSNSVEIKSSGEIKELVDSAENLRITILEQQQKIFGNIKQLEEAKNKAEASDRLKSEFLAVISHEIRTPLNVILGNVEILKLELDEEKIRELEDILEPIKQGSERLIRTVEMLVLYSELSSKSYNKREHYVDVDKLFFSSVEKHKKNAAAKGIKINFDCATTTGMIKADERLLEEAINQIADNAVKYTQKGEIIFCIRKTENQELKLIFNDTGIGISNEFMKELYKPFRQEDMSYERRFEGNGIGLALAKKCCDINGFGLNITSEKEKGTTVEIIIPSRHLFNEG
jgi:signal transduction histidine kinase